MKKFDQETVERYEAWFRTPAGAFALEREKRLLHNLISPWPRRGQKLLEVGCGTGLFLKMFWETGFDVTGMDLSPAMLDASRQRLGSRVDLHLGSADHLPFEDKSYDFVAILTVLEFVEDPLVALQEAARVAKKGLIISFLNRNSLYFLETGIQWPCSGKSLLRGTHWQTWRKLRQLIVEACDPRRMTLRSVLPGPMFTWRECQPFRWMNNYVLPLGIGSYCAARVDFIAAKPLTPLLSFTRDARVSYWGKPQGTFRKVASRNGESAESKSGAL